MAPKRPTTKSNQAFVVPPMKSGKELRTKFTPNYSKMVRDNKLIAPPGNRPMKKIENSKMYSPESGEGITAKRTPRQKVVS